MRTLLLLPVLIMHSFLAFALPSARTPQFMVMLSAGTPVQVTLNEALDLDVVMTGHAVDFTVRNNVVVNGKVLIAAGAWAAGIVRKVKVGCDGNCGTITITVEEARAVDGSVVRLRSMPHTMNAEVANVGVNLRALVLDDAWVNA